MLTTFACGFFEGLEFVEELFDILSAKVSPRVLIISYREAIRALVSKDDSPASAGACGPGGGWMVESAR